MEKVFEKLEDAIDIALKEQSDVLKISNATPVQIARRILVYDNVISDIKELATEMIKERSIKLNRKYKHF